MRAKRAQIFLQNWHFSRNSTKVKGRLYIFFPEQDILFILRIFQSFVAGENKYSGLGIPENQLSGRAHAENK